MPERFRRRNNRSINTRYVLMLQRIIRFGLAAIISISFVVLPEQAAAFGSGEKTPQETALENKKKAVRKYNNGVKHMKKARKKAEAADSLYAFNYRATSNAKARREYNKAIKDFNKALELDSALSEAQNNLGYCYRKLGLLKESLSAYSAALKLNTEFAKAYEYRGETHLAMGNLKLAERDLARLRKMESSYADSLAISIKLFQLAELNEIMQATDK